jgi:hypothetical protein
MSPSAFSRLFSSSMNTVVRRFLLSLIRVLLIYIISLLFVELPTFCRYITTLGKDDDKGIKQKEFEQNSQMISIHHHHIEQWKFLMNLKNTT